MRSHPGLPLVGKIPDFVDAAPQKWHYFIPPRAENGMRALVTKASARRVAMGSGVPPGPCPRRMYWGDDMECSCETRLAEVAIRLCSRHLGGVVERAGWRPIDNEDEP